MRTTYVCEAKRMNDNPHHTLAWTSGIHRTLDPWIKLTRVHIFCGSLLIFWPYAWGLTVVSRATATPVSVFITRLTYGFIGAALLHSAGCIWNDIVDKDLDCQVERTKGRPIASGKIKVPGALIFLVVHIIIMACIFRGENHLVHLLCWITILPLAGIYPYMKRITYFTNIWLGAALNTGVLVSSAAILDSFPTWVVLMYATCWCWTMWYDTIYGCQDMKDDMKSGIKSVALFIHPYGIKATLRWLGLVIIAGFITVGVLSNQGNYFFLGVAISAAHLALQLYRVDTETPSSCCEVFDSNGFVFGPIMFVGMLCDYINSLRP